MTSGGKERLLYMDAKNLAELYDLPIVDWSDIVGRLNAGVPQAPGTGGPDRHTCWLATIDADGRPHVTGIGGFWNEGTFWFQTGPATRKAKNLARDPRCSISVATHEFDLTLEGVAQRVTDPAVVADFAGQAASDGWPARVDDSGVALTADYSAPSAGPPPWFVYRITPHRAVALRTVDPGGATQWTFDR